jgi:hypothetical protein
MGRYEGAMRASITAAVLLVVTLWSAPTVAEASFNQQAASAQSTSSAMLHPPTNLSATRSSCTVTLSWTPTADATATGYRLYNGASLLQTITPKTASSQKITIARNSTYILTMFTYYLSWRSTASQPATISC